MAIIHCAISGLKIKVQYGPLTIPAREGYYHPIFALPRKKLLGLYSRSCTGSLSPTDNYLIFLAILHSSGAIRWTCPASCDPSSSHTLKLVQNNMRQLIEVVELTDRIIVPSFRQPQFIVASDNSDLRQIPNWIAAWNQNIEEFKQGYAAAKQREDLKKIENKLSYFIRSGLDTSQYISVVANWAEQAADFPRQKSERWKYIIRVCFNEEKVFSIPLAEIKEVKAYCEENIEAGSIHFHELHSALQAGIRNHSSFLGLEAVGYSLLPANAAKMAVEQAAIIAKAPDHEPVASEYSSATEFLKAKLRWRAKLAAKRY